MRQKEVKNRKDFLSVDSLTAISSEGDVFNVGDVVCYTGDDEDVTGTIQGFMLNKNTYDVQAIVELKNGWEVRGRISFLYHAENNKNE